MRLFVILAPLVASGLVGLCAYDQGRNAPAARREAPLAAQDVMLLGSIADQVFACAQAPTPSCAAVNAYADAIISGRVK